MIETLCQVDKFLSDRTHRLFLLAAEFLRNTADEVIQDIINPENERWQIQKLPNAKKKTSTNYNAEWRLRLGQNVWQNEMTITLCIKKIPCIKFIAIIFFTMMWIINPMMEFCQMWKLRLINDSQQLAHFCGLGSSSTVIEWCFHQNKNRTMVLKLGHTTFVGKHIYNHRPPPQNFVVFDRDIWACYDTQICRFPMARQRYPPWIVRMIFWQWRR